MENSYSLAIVMLCSHSRAPLTRLLRKLRSRRRLLARLRGASFHAIVRPYDPERHYRALFAFQTHRTVDLDLPVTL
jgi:hypothetical protein